MASVCSSRHLLCGTVGIIVLALVGLGCNAFDGIEPSPEGVDDLLADARGALTTGNPQRAVQLLERAYERDSTNVEVRVELANALYATHEIDVFAVRAAVEQMSGKGALADSGRSNGAVCTEDAAPNHSGGEQINRVSLNGEGALRVLANRNAPLLRVSRLLIDGVLNRRPDAFAAADSRVQAKGYLLATLTQMSRGLLRVRTALLETESALYVDPSRDDRSLFTCSPTTEGRDRVEGTLCRLQSGTQQSLSWLRARNDQTHSDQTGVLIEVLTRHAQALGDRPSCDDAPGGRTGPAFSQSRSGG